MLQGKVQATRGVKGGFDHLVQAGLHLVRAPDACANQGHVADSIWLGHGGLHKEKWREGEVQSLRLNESHR